MRNTAGYDRDERLRTLIEMLFGMHDSGGPGLEVLRREGPRLPVLGRSRDAIEEGIDGLILAALDPITRDPEAVAVVRGLAGMPVRRALRSAGVDDSAAVGLVADAVAAAFSPARR